MQTNNSIMKDQSNPKHLLLIALGLILLAAITRLLPHPGNFTAIGAIALFAGATFSKHRWAYLLPLAALFVTDLFLGIHFSIIPVYACIAFTVWLGTRVQQKPGILNIGLLSLSSSTLFFLITNLPIWYADLSLYPLTIAGTIQSYVMGIPFFKNQVLGDLFYNALIFGSYHFIAKSKKVEIA